MNGKNQSYHKDSEGKYILDENGDKISTSICLCYARCPSECVCGAWDDVEDDYEW